MDQFCTSDFWDNNITWRTTDPFFTSCFEETVLTYIPFMSLIIVSITEVPNWRNFKCTIPWNLLSRVKLGICVGLAAISTLEVILLFLDIGTITSSRLIAPISKLTSFLGVGSLIILSKRNGVSSSGGQSIFWLLFACCEAVLFRTAVRRFSGKMGSQNVMHVLQFHTFLLAAIQLVLCFWADSPPSSPDSLKKNQICAEESSSFFSKLIYAWFDKTALKGYRQDLTMLHLWNLRSGDTSHVQFERFFAHRNAGNKGCDLNTQCHGGMDILRILIRTYWVMFCAGGLFKLLADLAVFAQPKMLRLLVEFISDPEQETWKGYLYVGVLFLNAIFQMLLNSQSSERMLILGMYVKTSLSNAIYRKAILLSSDAKKESSVGEIMNLMSVDTQRLMDLAPFIHVLWSSPIKICLSVYFLYNTLGISAFAGLGVMLLLFPINAVVATNIRNWQVQEMKLKDERIKLMNEVLSGIKVLKLYAWELSFQERINIIRREEVKLLRKMAFAHCIISFGFTVAPTLVALATFSLYVLSDDKNVLSAEKTFVALTLFNIIRMPLTMFPMVIGLLVQALVSVKRLNKYFGLEEIDKTAVGHDSSEDDPVVIQDGTFSWTSVSAVLNGINLRVKAGSLTAIVGKVGSGKTTLIQAILGNIKTTGGHINTNGKIAYVSQEAWIQNASLRDNILFGDPMNYEKYDKVVECCALRSDLKILTAGDATEIGEKGLNLSGGQKQRVSLARAAYKESDIYLFDDPLSAVDSHVGKHIFSKLIGPLGLLNGKTRILATHSISFLDKVDCIVVIKDGMISEIGTYTQLLQRNGEFAEFLFDHIRNPEAAEVDGTLLNELEKIVGKEEVRRRSSVDFHTLSRKAALAAAKENVKNQEEDDSIKSLKSTGSLIDSERTETGGVALDVYLDYLKGFGMTTLTLGFLFNIIFQAFATYSSIWLSDWTDETTEKKIDNSTLTKDDTSMYLSGYGGLAAAQAITILIAQISLGLGALRSATLLHTNMLGRIIRAPMWYFDATPTGRLVNRFSKDVDTTDNLIPQNLKAFLNMVLSALSTIIIISYSTPVFLAAVVPITIAYVFLQRFYVATSRQLRRLDSVSKSPLYSHFGETISGATTIRAFGAESKFIHAYEKKMDTNLQTSFITIIANLWITTRVEVLGAFIVLAAGIISVLGRDSLSAGNVGLSISYALQITQLLNFMLRVTSDLETNVVAIERICETTQSPQEEDFLGNHRKPPKNWPQMGRIEFKDYQARYRNGMDLVLRGISFSVNPGEKVGIVGRTGAGKSSLTLSLFRIIEPAGGQILIDGVDLSNLLLQDIRSRITIIPQEPVLFCGTLRENLDPCKAHNDNVLWKCLELAHLKGFVKSSQGGLSQEVTEEGQNYSIGQKQLICLARAILQKSSILVLDEATAAVDMETDLLVQKTILKEFANSTVITIAHRLNTIMDCDRVLVLHEGQLCEFDSPRKLLKNRKSIFYSMAKDAGLVS